jgi:hypothetical protein
MQLTTKDLAFLRDCARRYAPQDMNTFEADVFDGLRAGLHLGDAIVEAWGEAARLAPVRLTENAAAISAAATDRRTSGLASGGLRRG